jgi:hypothetical protein
MTSDRFHFCHVSKIGSDSEGEAAVICGPFLITFIIVVDSTRVSTIKE